MTELSEIGAAISAATGTYFAPRQAQDVRGGCINATKILSDGKQRFFVKLNASARKDMFAAEAAGLRELNDARAVRVPKPICYGISGERAYLVLEYLPLSQNNESSDARFGAQLAQLHRTTRPTFGWERDNTIGATPQINTDRPDWIEFWRDQRLGYQLSLSIGNGYARRLEQRGNRLSERLVDFFVGYRPTPALLHGDLWSGNYAAAADGSPVCFDPAVYYGDRETDIAMTELFGDFSPHFYKAYRSVWPLDPGYEVRKTLYNLYHVLNHLNLFGGGYLSQAERMIDRLLSEVS